MIRPAASPAASYMLDTNILVAYMRGGPLGHYVEKEFGLQASPYRPLVCVVCFGEILSLARQWSWGLAKVSRLWRLLREVVRIDVSSEEVLQKYAELDHYCLKVRKPAEPIGKNDLWVAAAAATTGATLLTTDRHYDKFHPAYLKRVFIDPSGA